MKTNQNAQDKEQIGIGRWTDFFDDSEPEVLSFPRFAGSYRYPQPQEGTG